MINVLKIALALFLTASCFAQSFGKLILIPTATDSATGEMQFREKVANGTNYVGFKAPASIAANVVWTLPSTDGTNGQVIQTNGSGVMSWVTPAGSNIWSRASTTVSLVNSGDTVSLSGPLAVTGDTTLSGHIFTTASGTKDIGTSSNRFQTLYVTNVDAAPTGGTTNYIKTRKFEVADNTGGVNIWDMQVTSTGIVNNFKIRDNAGTYRLELANREEVTGTTVNEARLNYHTVPLVHNTWDLGTTGKRWKDLYLQGAATIAGNTTVSGVVATPTLDDISDANNQIVLNAGFRPASDNTVNIGASANRVAGVWTNSLTVNTLTYASGTGSTITLYANMAPFTTNNFALGTSSLRYSKLWVTDIDFSGTCTGCAAAGYFTRTVAGGVGGTNILSQATAADEIVSSANVYPSVTNSKELGLSSRRWNTVWGNFGDFASNVNVGGNITVTGTSALTGNATFSGNVLAAANETKTIGTTANRWDIVYSRRFEAWDGTYSRVVINNPGAGSNSGNAIAVNNASGTSKFYVSYGGTVSTGPISLNGDIYTSTGGTYSIGDSTNRMKDIYATTGNFSSTLTVGGILYPAAVIAGTGAPDGYGFYSRSQDGTKEWFAFAYNASGAFMGTTTNDYLMFRTNNTNRGVISAAGALNWYGAVDFDSTLNVDGATTLSSLTVTGTCTGCGTSYWTRNGAGYVYPTTTGDSVIIGGSGTPGDKLEVSGGGVKLGGNITFSLGSAYNLGSSSYRAANLYSVYGDFSGSVTAAGISLAGNITPTVSEFYAAGSTSYPFDSVYSRQLIARNTTNSVNQVVISGSTGTAVGVYDTSGSLSAYISRSGTVSANSVSSTLGYNVNGAGGLTQTLNVRTSSGAASCTIIVTGGIITSSTC